MINSTLTRGGAIHCTWHIALQLNAFVAPRRNGLCPQPHNKKAPTGSGAMGRSHLMRRLWFGKSERVTTVSHILWQHALFNASAEITASGFH